MSGTENRRHRFGWAELRFLVFPALQVFGAVSLLRGGAWLWAGIALTASVFLLWDMIVVDDETTGSGAHAGWFDAIIWLIVGFAFFQLALLLVLASHDSTGTVEMLAAASLVGIQLGVTAGVAGHELIHRTNRRWDMAVGRVLFACSLRPDIPIEHVYGHHRNVGTAEDPATARRGVGFWRYLPTALWRSCAKAHDFERTRLSRKGTAVFSPRNRFLQGLTFAVLAASLFVLSAGASGLMALIAAAAIGSVIVELFNYISHYGLVRIQGEPIMARHSWNSYRVVSTSAMINLSRHSSHHLAATRPYWNLPHQEDGPVLPHGSAIMAFIAMFPAWYFHAMKPALENWDKTLASPAERAYFVGARRTGG